MMAFTAKFEQVSGERLHLKMIISQFKPSNLQQLAIKDKAIRANMQFFKQVRQAKEQKGMVVQSSTESR